MTTDEAARRKFWLDLLERAVKSFLQGFGLAWSAGAASILPGDWAGWKALLAGAGMAGLSAVFSGFSRLRGDKGSASAIDLDKAAAPAVPRPGDVPAARLPMPVDSGPVIPAPAAYAPGGMIGAPAPVVLLPPDGVALEPPRPDVSPFAVGDVDDDLLDGAH